MLGNLFLQVEDLEVASNLLTLVLLEREQRVVWRVKTVDGLALGQELAQVHVVVRR